MDDPIRMTPLETVLADSIAAAHSRVNKLETDVLALVLVAVGLTLYLLITEGKE